jgi:RecA-family ATPase
MQQPGNLNPGDHDDEGTFVRHFKPKLNGGEAEAPKPFPWLDMSRWDSEPVPEREWAVPGRIPLRQVALFSGDGAVGKSTVEMQLSVAHVLGKDWLGALPEPGPAFYCHAGEDDERELRIRLHNILSHYGTTHADLVANGFYMRHYGDEAVLGAPDRNNIIQPTRLYDELYEQAGDIKPRHIGIDSSADVFAGNEIDRSQVRQFIGLLRRLARVSNGCVVLLSHPSVAGLNSGSGISGSTAWHNSVRARFYMASPKPENDGESDTDLRELTFKKLQYGKLAENIVLRYQRGLFLPDATMSSLNKVAREQQADDVFLTLLAKYDSDGRQVSDKATANNYAPKLFVVEKEAKERRLKKDELADAQRRLFDAQKIEVEHYGRPSRPYSRLRRKQ